MMNQNLNPRRIVVLAVLFLFALQSMAQEEIDKRVQVVKAYKPKIGEAYKISELPEITDTTQTDVRFDYYLLPKRIETEFQPDPIPSARMVGEPLTELYGNYIKLGMGSKMSPAVEAYFTNKRSEKHAIGTYFSHYSSGGKVALKNDERTFAGYSDTRLRLFGKQFFDHSVLSADAGLASNTNYFYGFSTEQDTTLNKEDIRQNFLRVDLGAAFKSTYVDSAHLNYDIDLDFDHVQDEFKTKENGFKIDVDLDKFYDHNMVGLNTGYRFMKQESPLDTVKRSLFNFSPWIGKFGEEWRIQGGVNFVADVSDGNTKARIYPVARMEYDIIDQYIIPYAGIDGNVQFNSYNDITQKNPFVLPGLDVENTNNKMIFYAGMKGNLSSSTFYNLKVKYTFFDNQHFFVNDIQATDGAGNQFNVVYYEGERLNLFGEISFDLSESFNVRAEGNIYRYTFYDNMDDGMKAWHKPSFDLTVSGKYNLRDKIILQTDIFFVGSRWVSGLQTENPKELDGFVDFNLGLEYRYSKVLSGYLKLRNILSDNYYQWNHYPVYGLQAFLGITYAF